VRKRHCSLSRYNASMTDSPTQHMQCMEVWGGRQLTSSRVELASLDVWVYSKPFGQAQRILSRGPLFELSVVMLVLIATLLIHSPKFTVPVQGTKLALVQGDPIVLERSPQRSSVGHCFRELLEPNRHNPRSATLPSSSLSLQCFLRTQHRLQLRLARATRMPMPGPGVDNRCRTAYWYRLCWWAGGVRPLLL
jgi:hypothetical protein